MTSELRPAVVEQIDRDAAEDWKWVLYDREDYDPVKEMEKNVAELAADFARHREAVRAEVARAIEVELSMCAIANVEAPSEWIDGFEFAWKRVKEALHQYKEATNV